MMYPDPTYIPRPLPPEGSICVVKYGRRAGSRVTVLEPLITDPEVKPVQVMVQFENGETYAKFPHELEEIEAWLHALAQKTAKQEAERYYEQEHMRSKMLAFSYVAQRIASAIGQAHFDAGFPYTSFSVESRETYARDALRVAGYLEEQA